MNPLRLVRPLLAAAALLLAAAPVGAAQARGPAADLRAHRPPLLPSAAPASGSGAVSPGDGGGPGIARSTLTGAAVGAAAGVIAFLVLEATVEHTDHSEDGLVFFTLTVPATAAGALIGLIAGATSART